MKYRDSAAGILTLAKKLGEGGEGQVFATAERPDLVAKIYTRPLAPAQIAKLETMIRRGDDGLRSVAAWPMGVVRDGVKPVGFTMPHLTAQHPLHDSSAPSGARRCSPTRTGNF